jgi:hypothetical protein
MNFWDWLELAWWNLLMFTAGVVYCDGIGWWWYVLMMFVSIVWQIGHLTRRKQAGI